MLASQGDPGKRIAVITSSYPRYPGDSAGHFVESEVRSLIRSGHTVTVFAAGREASPASTASSTQMEEGQATVVFLGGPSLFDHPGALPRLAENPLRALGLLSASAGLFTASQSMRERGCHSFDRIIAHWLFPCALPWASILASRKLPLEVVIHGSDLRLLLALPRPLREALLNSLQRRRVLLRFVSSQMVEELLSTSLPEKLRSFIGEAHVEPAKLDLPIRLSRNVARARLSLSPNERWGVFVGRLIEQKRPGTALAAAELIPDLQIAVVGEGPLRKELEAQFPRAKFLGQTSREQALIWIAAADLCLSPSKLEGAPTAVREARALGTPVVAANSGDCRIWGRSDPGLWIVD